MSHATLVTAAPCLLAAAIVDILLLATVDPYDQFMGQGDNQLPFRVIIILVAALVLSPVFLMLFRHMLKQERSPRKSLGTSVGAYFLVLAAVVAASLFRQIDLVANLSIAGALGIAGVGFLAWMR